MYMCRNNPKLGGPADETKYKRQDEKGGETPYKKEKRGG